VIYIQLLSATVRIFVHLLLKLSDSNKWCCDQDVTIMPDQMQISQNNVGLVQFVYCRKRRHVVATIMWAQFQMRNSQYYMMNFRMIGIFVKNSTSRCMLVLYFSVIV